MSATGLSRLEVLNWWEAEFKRHHAEVRAHFEGNPRFVEFNIETDDFGKIATLLEPDYPLELGEWGNRGGKNQARKDKQRSSNSIDNVRTKRSVGVKDLFRKASYSYFYNEVLRRD